MDDHPWQKLPLAIENKTTGQPNFLYRASRHFEAITVFIARNETGVIQPLLHAGWGAIWSVGFRWVGKGGLQCVPSMKAKAFFASDVSKGAPAGLDSKITHPATDEKDTCNFLSAQAVHFSRDARNPSTVYSESSTWGSDVPPEFSPVSK